MTLPTLIAELEEALKAATAGPWTLDGIAIAHLQRPYGAPIDVCLMGEPAQYPGDTTPLLPNYEANARLIALMRNHLPALIDAVKRQVEALAEIARHDNTGITGPGRQQADSCVQIARAALKETTDV